MGATMDKVHQQRLNRMEFLHLIRTHVRGVLTKIKFKPLIKCDDNIYLIILNLEFNPR